MLSKTEVESRRVVNLSHYVGTVEMEANCMVDLIVQHIIPAIKDAQQDPAALKAAADKVAAKLATVRGGFSAPPPLSALFSHCFPPPL